MKLDSIVVAALYQHFYNMKKKGRKVIPWFQTVSVISFSIMVTFVLITLILLELLNGGKYEIGIKEMPFLIIFVLLVILLFILIKRQYFNTNKHLLYFEEFSSLSPNKQKRYKVLVLLVISLLPFILLFIIYTFDNRIK
jgi:hypothetical protein